MYVPNFQGRWDGHGNSNLPQVRNHGKSNLPKIQDHRNLTCLKSDDQALKFSRYAGLAFWQFCSMQRSSHNCKLGGGAAETAGGQLELASSTVYIAELLRNSLARETTEKQKPYFTHLQEF